jgi:hypothetical protein
MDLKCANVNNPKFHNARAASAHKQKNIYNISNQPDTTNMKHMLELRLEVPAEAVKTSVLRGTDL